MIDPKEYGRALFMLAEERGSTEAVYEDIKTVRTVLQGNPSYLRLMDTPAVALSEKEALIDRAFSCVDRDVVSFLKILAGKHSLYAFAQTVRTFEDLYEESRGIVRAEAVTAVAMTDDQLRVLREKLCRITGKTIRLRNTVDPTVLGGMKLRYLGKQIDGTLASRLRGLDKAVKNTIV